MAIRMNSTKSNKFCQKCKIYSFNNLFKKFVKKSIIFKIAISLIKKL